ncbi:MAG: carbohydrate kinase family protein [Culicoidibacterales bacterium]
MNRNDKYVVVIGATLVDVIGTPKKRLMIHDSNPGTIRTVFGGVSRNIACNLQRLGVNVVFITIVGNDTDGRGSVEDAKKIGINMDCTIFRQDIATAKFMCMNQEDRDLYIGIADTKIVETMSVADLKPFEEIIRGASACVVNTDNPREILEYLIAEHEHVPLFVDTISAQKAARVKDLIHTFYAIKPNDIEAEAFLDLPIEDAKDYVIAVDSFIEHGVKRVFLSLGSKGLYYADETKHGHVYPIPVKIKNTLGAGDSVMAAMVYSYLHDMAIEESAHFATATAAMTIQSKGSTNETLTAKKVRALMQTITNRPVDQ